METFQWPRLSLVFHFMLMTSSFFVILCKAEDPLPCPSPCECYKENYQPYGDVNTIECANLKLTAVPNLTPLVGSNVPNNLVLHTNEIKEITKADFPPGLNIILLDLSQNIGVKIADDTFLNLGYSLKKLKLEVVDLVYDKTLVMFDSLFSLELLSLDNNNKHPYTKGAVENVDVSLFQGEVAKSLKKLKLAFCGIRTMSERSLDKLLSLEELNLSNNWFVSIPLVLKPLTSLKFVEFFYCDIKSLKDNDFSGLPNLEKIDLASNSGLTTIADKSFSGCEKSLTQLNLQRCGLKDVPTEALKRLKKITFLDISENKFANVGSGALTGEYKLNNLVISSPNLDFKPDIFKGQESNIVDVSIPRMNLKTIPLSSLRKLTQLQRLSLEYNNITMLPENAFSGITASSIILDNNPLSSIQPGAFNGLPPRLVLSLRRTKMTDIDFLLDYPSSAIDTVNIEHSNLVCRCSMKSSINVTKTMHVYGSCSKGEDTLHISSSKLEGILDQACKEENAGNSCGTVVFGLILWVVPLLLFQNRN